MLGVSHARRVTFPGANLEQAVHRCMDLAARFGAIHLLRPVAPGIREFFLELGEAGQPRLRWTLKSLNGGTELTIVRQASVTWLTTLGRHGSRADLELERKLDLLPHLLNFRIVVLGGGTGLYTTLLGLRDRTSSLTAIVRPRAGDGPAEEVRDEFGSLPHDDPGLALVALAPPGPAWGPEDKVLRRLLQHPAGGPPAAGTPFGTLLLDSLARMQGSAQAALDAAGRLLGIRGRLILLLRGGPEDRRAAYVSAEALDALNEADVIVLAPGDFERQLVPVLKAPGLIEALQASPALKIAVTRIMTRDGDERPACLSQELEALHSLAPDVIDVVLANDPAFSEEQLRRYAGQQCRPVVPDRGKTARYVKRVVTERLAAAGTLARHDPARLGDRLMEIASTSLLEAPRLPW